jgi:hypothetical protein
MGRAGNVLLPFSSLIVLVIVRVLVIDLLVGEDEETERRRATSTRTGERFRHDGDVPSEAKK